MTLPNELSNFDIDLIIKQVFPKKAGERFKGVFRRNEIENIELRNGDFLIMNLDGRRDGPGTHWTALIRKDSKGKARMEYYDSYGAIYPTDVPKMKEIQELADKNNLVLWYNKTDFQPMGNNMCGWYAIRAIYLRSLNKPVNKTSMYTRSVRRFKKLIEEKKLPVVTA